jgi:NADH:ubiquinone oxidoreductase subunit D
LVGVSSALIESPKGEYGVLLYLFKNGFIRCRIRCCDYVHVLMLDFFKGFMLCDLVGILGNIDVVFGSVDR